MFNIKKSDMVLDLGCGDGLNISLLHKMGIKKVVGVDISEKLLKMARANNPKAKLYLGSVQKIPFKANTFDIVLVDSVFHHLMKYGEAAKEIKRVLKKGGRLCFMEPHRSLVRNFIDFVSVLPLSNYYPFIGKRAKAYKEEIDLMSHWLETEEEFLSILEEEGFKKEFCKVVFLSIVACYKKP